MKFKKNIPAKKYYTPEEIMYNHDLGTIIFDDILSSFVAISLSKIPMKIADKILNKFYFFTGNRCIGKCMGPDFLKNRGVIFISTSHLKRAKLPNIVHTILHEIAHYILKHTASHGTADILEKSMSLNQEREANQQVKKWLKEYEKSDPITKFDLNEWTKELWRANGITI